MDIVTTNTILYCRKWSETVDFYKNGLGLEVEFKNEWFVEFIVNSSARLSIAYEKRSIVKSSGGKGLTLTFQVEDLESAHEQLIRTGLKPLPIKNHTWNARVFHIYDPEGNRVEFWMTDK